MPRPDAMDSMPNFGGKLLDNKRLLLLNCLGSGGYGKVYRALGTSPAKFGDGYRAVKVLRRETLDTPRAQDQLREFNLQSKVHAHAHIATFHKIVTETKYIYAIFEFYAGGDLFNAITRRRLYHRNDALITSAFLQIIDAVQFCHKAGIYHRDLKPENILVSKSGRNLYLSDFGLATQNAVSSTFGCGSSFYMAPEVVSEALTDGSYLVAPTDVWSLGIILTNLCTGRCPWRKAEALDSCFSAYLHDANFLRSVLPISLEANDVLKSVFQLNPLSRVSLSQLRVTISSVQSFFTSKEEAAGSSRPVLRAATPARSPPPPEDAGIIFVDEPSSTAQSSPSKAPTDHSLPHSERFACPTPDENTCPPNHPPLPGTIGAVAARVNVVRKQHPSPNNLPQVSSAEEEGLSEDESDGPITPDDSPDCRPTIAPDEIEVLELEGGVAVQEPETRKIVGASKPTRPSFKRSGSSLLKRLRRLSIVS
ncbi:serine/threonine protein kinase, negative regulator of sexual conjugation and meiosis [Flagelloscypha sp. PMI_526]|nr:serine/threonine protein kinase, negative regulator of sexual conjugation and meiosis [Flagelloscypha sp. PMI_526]